MPFEETDWSLSSKYTGDDLAQEAKNAADEAASAASDATDVATAADSKATAADTKATTAAADASTAKSTATTAKTAADNAASAAATAKTAADTAQSTADTAKTTATTANEKAEQALAKAGYLQYDSPSATLTLGAVGDPSKVCIDNDSMDIVVDGETIASFGENITLGYAAQDIQSGSVIETAINLVNVGGHPLGQIIGRYEDYDWAVGSIHIKSNQYISVGDDDNNLISFGTHNGGLNTGNSVTILSNDGIDVKYSDEYGIKFNNGGLPIKSGGTGATSAAAARTNLGFDVKTYDVKSKITASGATVNTAVLTVYGGRFASLNVTHKYKEAHNMNTGSFNLYTLAADIRPSVTSSATLWDRGIGILYPDGVAQGYNHDNIGSGWDGSFMCTYILANEYFG